jgi:hypothetical protein
MVAAMRRLLALLVVLLGLVALAAGGGTAKTAARTGSDLTTAQVRAHRHGHHHKCDPNYTGACLRPNVSDYDCLGGSGNGPYYTGEVRVVGVDHYGLDADGDGIGCEGD